MSGNPPLRQACLIVLVGAPASGKSTWAQRNGHGAVHISQDGLIDAITPQGFDHVYRPVYAAAEDALASAALREGHTVIVDRTNRTRGHRGRWLKIAQEVNAPAIAVEMAASAEVCRMRNRARIGPRRLTEERISRMLHALEPVHREEGFSAIYTGEVTLMEILSDMFPERRAESHEHCYTPR